jgi:hypothetical protein
VVESSIGSLHLRNNRTKGGRSRPPQQQNCSTDLSLYQKRSFQPLSVIPSLRRLIDCVISGEIELTVQVRVLYCLQPWHLSALIIRGIGV